MSAMSVLCYQFPACFAVICVSSLVVGNPSVQCWRHWWLPMDVSRFGSPLCPILISQVMSWRQVLMLLSLFGCFTEHKQLFKVFFCLLQQLLFRSRVFLHFFFFSGDCAPWIISEALSHRCFIVPTVKSRVSICRLSFSMS